MTGTKSDFIGYRISKAKEVYKDATILSEKGRWTSTINRLYYAAYYALIALLLDSDFNTGTHNGVKTLFSEHFIKTGLIDAKYGKIYSQLFTWRQKGDYDDLFDFNQEMVVPYFKPVKELIGIIDERIQQS